MQESERAEIVAAYDAVLALMTLTASSGFRFRVGVMGGAQWTRIRSTSGLDAGERMGIESVELGRCSVELARGVLRHVLEIARAPGFGDRCLNADGWLTTPQETSIDLKGDIEVVLYLTKYRERPTEAQANEEVHMPRPAHAMSGVRPRVEQMAPVEGDLLSEAVVARKG